jgi:hypothetical protein
MIAGQDPLATHAGFLDMQVCVPADFTDEAVKHFAETTNPCGTTTGWQIRREGDKSLAGYPERMPCKERAGFVHVMLDA